MSDPQHEKPTDYTGVIILVFILPVIWFFMHIGKTDLGLNLGVCLGMLVLAIKIRWDLRTRLWFWCVISLLLVLHLPLILKIHWPAHWVPAIVLLPIGVADLFAILGIIGFVEKHFVEAATGDEEV